MKIWSGSFLHRLSPITFQETIQLGLQAFVPTLAFFFAIAGVIGIFFGLIMARWLTRRLNRLSDAAAAWGQG